MERSIFDDLRTIFLDSNSFKFQRLYVCNNVENLISIVESILASLSEKSEIREDLINEYKWNVISGDLRYIQTFARFFSFRKFLFRSRQISEFLRINARRWKI